MNEQYIIPPAFRVGRRWSDGNREPEPVWNAQRRRWENPSKQMLDPIAFLTMKEVGEDTNTFTGWIDGAIPVVSVANTVRAGFSVYGLTKRSSEWFGSGRHVWRIEHPDGFVFEISSENMAALLIHSDLIEGGIKQPCVLAWRGQSLALIPNNSTLYQQALRDTLIRSKSVIPVKELIPGYVVRMSNGEVCQYMGTYDVMHRKEDRYIRNDNRTGLMDYRYRAIYRIKKRQPVFIRLTVDNEHDDSVLFNNKAVELVDLCLPYGSFAEVQHYLVQRYKLLIVERSPYTLSIVDIPVSLRPLVIHAGVDQTVPHVGGSIQNATELYHEEKDQYAVLFNTHTVQYPVDAGITEVSQKTLFFTQGPNTLNINVIN